MDILPLFLIGLVCGPAQTWLLSVVHKFSVELRSRLLEGHSRSSMWAWFIKSKTSFGILISSSTVVVGLHYSSAPVPLTAKQPQSMMLPLSNLIVSTVFIGLKASPLLQTYLLLLWPNGSIFALSGYKSFPQKAFGLSVWAAPNFSQAWRWLFWSSGCFLGQHPLSHQPSSQSGETGLLAVSSSWQTWTSLVPGLFLNILTSCLSCENEGLGLHPEFDKVVTDLNNLCLQTIVWSWNVQFFRNDFERLSWLVYIYNSSS